MPSLRPTCVGRAHGTLERVPDNELLGVPSTLGWRLGRAILAFSDMPGCEVLHTCQGEMTRPQPRASLRWRPSLRTCGVPERKAPLRVGLKVDGVGLRAAVSPSPR